MDYALFKVAVGTLFDHPETMRLNDEGQLVSTIGDEGLYGQACQVRTAPGGVTAAGVPLPPDVAEVVSFYGYHGYVHQSELQFLDEGPLWDYLAQRLVLVGRATDVLNVPRVQGVRMLELEQGGVLRRLPETAEEAQAHPGWAKVMLVDGPDRLCPGCGAGGSALPDDGGVLPAGGAGLQRCAGRDAGHHRRPAGAAGAGGLVRRQRGGFPRRGLRTGGKVPGHRVPLGRQIRPGHRLLGPCQHRLYAVRRAHLPGRQHRGGLAPAQK